MYPGCLSSRSTTHLDTSYTLGTRDISFSIFQRTAPITHSWSRKINRNGLRIQQEPLPATKGHFLQLHAIQLVPYTLGSIPLNVEVGKGSGKQPGRINGAEKQVPSFEQHPRLPIYDVCGLFYFPAHGLRMALVLCATFRNQACFSNPLAPGCCPWQSIKSRNRSTKFSENSSSIREQFAMSELSK